MRLKKWRIDYQTGSVEVTTNEQAQPWQAIEKAIFRAFGRGEAAQMAATLNKFTVLDSWIEEREVK
jgi:rRNA processing protein Krr1/Pno1